MENPRKMRSQEASPRQPVIGLDVTSAGRGRRPCHSPCISAERQRHPISEFAALSLEPRFLRRFW